MGLRQRTHGLDEAFCLGCGYRLRALPEHRCPECGRVFDPTDPRTMSFVRPLRPWQIWLLQPIGWRTISLALAGTACLAWLSRLPRLSPEPVSVLMGEFRWPKPYMMPLTIPDVIWYAAVGLWAMFVALVLFWALVRLLLVPRAGRRANVCTNDTGRRRRTVGIAAMLSVLLLVFGWRMRIGQRWMTRVAALPPVVPVAATLFNSAARGPSPAELQQLCPARLSPEQAQDVLAASVTILPAPKERFCAVKVLVETAPATALSVIVNAEPNEQDADVLASELRLISLYRNPSTASLLVGRLSDSRPEVRAAAADAVGVLRQPTSPIAANPYSLGIYDALALDTTPPISVQEIVSLRWASVTLPEIPIASSARAKLESMMAQGSTEEEREAAARALVAWPPDQFKLRVAEWGVWAENRGHMALVRSILDEIPPFVHRTGNPVSDFASYFRYPMDVFKPVVHLTSDVPLAADVEVHVSEGRPWFAYPKPDDFGIGVEPETSESKPFRGFVPPQISYPGSITAIPPTTPDDITAPTIPPMSDCREGYPWMSPHHRLYSSTYGGPEIFRLGLRWQSVIISPTRLNWMVPPAVPADPRFKWWRRLREVPSCWVASRNESERFLYYDGPTRARVPVAVRLELSGKHLVFTTLPGDRKPPHETGSNGVEVHNLMHPMAATSRPNVPAHEGMYVEVRSGQIRAKWMEITGDGAVSLELDPALVGETAVAGRLRGMLVRYGLTGPEADGLIAAWAPQFFRTEGRRFILRMSPAEYARQCPMQVRPTPTEVVRLGLVLTEFDAKLPKGK